MSRGNLLKLIPFSRTDVSTGTCIGIRIATRAKSLVRYVRNIQGRAIDVRLGGFSTRRLHELARQMGRGGVGFYPRSDFVHLDSGPVRFW
jgi:uncharacterized protein YcbK (DUF882 family)